MATKYSTELRNAMCQALLDTLGPGHLVRYYDGTQPTNPQTALSGNTLRATLTADSTPGSISGGVLTFDAANYTQSNGSHVTGAATWVSMQKADGTRVYEFGISGDGHTLTGTITTGQDIARGAWTWTAPGA